MDEKNHISMVIYLDEDNRPSLNLYSFFEKDYPSDKKAVLMVIAYGLAVLAQDDPITVMQIGKQSIDEDIAARESAEKADEPVPHKHLTVVH